MDQEDVPLEGQIREKLVRTKERWAEEGRLLTGTTADPTRERLPPGQTLVKDWPVLDLGVQPDVSTAKFRLRLEGFVEKRLAFDGAARGRSDRRRFGSGAAVLAQILVAGPAMTEQGLREEDEAAGHQAGGRGLVPLRRQPVDRPGAIQAGRVAQGEGLCGVMTIDPVGVGVEILGGVQGPAEVEVRLAEGCARAQGPRRPTPAPQSRVRPARR